ncbi:MAG: hypothetical protein GY795_12755 [Desulfobacterales bacterium]|nr:hypothetical protein [Desulfobacterales bacterium]
MDASVVNILRLISVVVAAVMLGKWFQKEVMKARVKGAWYKAYYSPPGLIIIASVIILPLVIWAIKN